MKSQIPSRHGEGSGRENGRETCENKLGIHGRTAEQHSEAGREGGLKGGLKSAIARGQTPWVTGRIPEVEYAYALSFLSEYQGKGHGNNNELIALELNIEYHDCEEVRTARAVQSNLHQYRKSLENRV